ncbi:MAG TPA: transcription termination/antitermination NusG family protein [Verrucomicrobiae bacterium]|nr:transcription termination/antitermination NusG family protein [Verrucomicrobiae bacterium]
MRRSHVEKRSYKTVARQYVSETHDHKPDAGYRGKVIAMTNKQFPHWYAVYTKPQSEAKADQELRRLGYYTFAPFQRVRRRRKRPNSNVYLVDWVDRPYFANYIFVSIRNDEESLFGVSSANGVSSVVYFGGEPLRIPHRVMDEIMAKADENGIIASLDATECRRLAAGSKVHFHRDTVFSGFIAEVAIDAGKEIRVWLDLLGSRREVSVSRSAIVETSP